MGLSHRDSSRPLLTPSRASTSLLVLLAGSLGGCMVGPDYTAPTIAVPEKFAATGASVTETPVQLAQWWTTLGDPQLDALITRAAAENLDVKEAALRLREVLAARGIAAGELLPSVNTGGAYSRNRNSQNTFSPGAFRPSGQEHDNYNVAIDTAWELDVWGRIRRGIEAADADIGAAADLRRDVLVLVLSEVARNYVQLRTFQQRLDIARKNVSSQQETVDLSNARLKAGLSSELDVARARAQLETTRSQIPLLEQGVSFAAHRLGVLLGTVPSALIAELGPPKPIPMAAAPIPVGLPSDLLRRRADIRAAERQVAGASARIGVATADLFPRFSLSGQFGFTSSQIGDLFDSPSRFWSFGPSVRWALFQGGRIKANISVQEFRRDQSVVRWQRSVLTALEETENALVSVEQQKVRRASLAEAVRANQRAVDLANDLYKRGLADFFSVLDTQRQLFSLQDQLADAEGQVTLNMVSLYRALGGGWQPFEEGAPTGASDKSEGPTAPSGAASASAHAAVAEGHR